MSMIERMAAASRWRAAGAPRIAPGGLREMGLPAWALSKAGGWASGGGEVRLLRTLGRNGPLLRGYLRFGNALVTLGKLPRADTELVTLRTAWNVGCWYEFLHHFHLSRASGLSVRTVEKVAEGPAAAGWTPRQHALLTATDELNQHRMISDGTWDRLAGFLDQAQLVELCLLVGHYEMLAMLLKSAGVEPEPGAWQRGPLRWLRPDDDSDALFPRRSAHLSRQVTGPLMRLGVPLPPPYAVIVHKGRRSGRVYRTPVVAFTHRSTLVVPLGHGERTDWLRNLLAAERGGVERMGRLHRFSSPRVTDHADSAHLLPAPVRGLSRSLRLLVADIEK